MFPLTPGSSLQSSGWIRSLGSSSRDEAWPSVWQMFPERLDLIHIALELLLWTGSCQRSGLVACLWLVRPLERETGAVWVCEEGKRDRLGTPGRRSSWNLLLGLQRLDPITMSYHPKQIFRQAPCWGALVIILCYWFGWNRALIPELCVCVTWGVRNNKVFWEDNLKIVSAREDRTETLLGSFLTHAGEVELLEHTETKGCTKGRCCAPLT